MEAIEIYEQINDEGGLILNTPLFIRNKKVRIILLVENDLENEV